MDKAKFSFCVNRRDQMFRNSFSVQHIIKSTNLFKRKKSLNRYHKILLYLKEYKEPVNNTKKV